VAKKLEKLQHNFIDHIYKKSATEIFKYLPYQKEEALKRLNIYRNNIFGNFKDALASTYEVVFKLLGEEYFDVLAEKFIKKNPSKSGNLDEYGFDFAEFLKSQNKNHKLLYLSDVAKLESLYQQVLIGFDYQKITDFNIKKFREINEDDFFNLTFELHKSVKLLKSKYAIFSIWDSNISEEEDGKKDQRKLKKEQKINFQKQEFILIEKIDEEILVRKLEMEEFIFLSEIQKGKNLYEIYKKIIDCQRRQIKEILKKDKFGKGEKTEGDKFKDGKFKDGKTESKKVEFDIGLILQKFINLKIINKFNSFEK
jgi:hypothetical protein